MEIMRRLAVAAVAAVALSTVLATRPAFAFIGNGGCPHGNEISHFDSSGCRLNTSINRFDADVTQTFGSVSVAGGEVRRRIAVFAGSPCTNFMEIGQRIQFGGTFSVYSAAIRPGLNYTANWNTGHLGDSRYVVWYSSATNGGTFNVYQFLPNGTAKFVDNQTGLGFGGCKATGGTVILGGSLNNFSANNSRVSNLYFATPSGTTNSFTDAIVDRPCGINPSPCMNGALYNGNTIWDSNRG
jgi:hypothetical protein